MISGYSTNLTYSSSTHRTKDAYGGFPVPFNIPKVLHNLFSNDLDLELDNKQKDILHTLKFSYNALQNMLQQYTKNKQELRKRLLQNPRDDSLKEEYEALELDKMDAINDFKSLLEVMADMLTPQQYEKLLRFSNLPI